MINKPLFKLHILTFSITVAISQIAFASAVRDDVDYQYFRDFAENKGKFTVGASDIEIINKQGESVGTMLKDLPMMDFSVISRNDGVATLATEQHIVSVAHNTGYGSVSFGGSDQNPDAHHFNYLIADRNNYSNTDEAALPVPDSLKARGRNGYNPDYHAPRLHKLVTETAHAPVPEDNLNVNNFFDPQHYSSFVRAGSGTQEVRSLDGTSKKDVAGAYHYLTGGATMPILERTPEAINFGTDISMTKYGPLVTFTLAGDSGSGVFGYNVQRHRWEFIGTITTITTTRNNYLLNRPEYLQNLARLKTVNVDSQGGILNWQNTESGNSTIDNGNTQTAVSVYDPNLPKTLQTPASRPALGNGKTLHFRGQTGTLNLTQDINQGAGALYFDTDFTVKGADESTTWQGAGVSVAKDKTVQWQVKNPTSDRLSKIGEGTLVVNGKGANTGDISVGDGTVVLNQTDGHAFNQLGIVSGRATVRLDADNQINPDNIYFGFRGGRLDVNGHDLTFGRIQNVDDGAKIVNNNQSAAATVTITGMPLADINSLTIDDRIKPNQDLYHWKKDKNLTTIRDGRPYDYFLPKNGRTSGHPEYTTNQTSNEHWEYLGDDLDKAKQIALERKNERLALTAFNGYFGETDNTKHNGNLNVVFDPAIKQSTLLVSGGTQLNGNLTANDGNLLLSGRPVPHAYDHLKKSDVIYEDNWLNRTFNATSIIANNNATVFVGRNVSAVNANLIANNNATFNLGVIQDTTPECIRSDYTGVVKCENKTLSEKALASSPELQITSNATLNNDSSLNLGKAHLTGRIQGTGNVSLQADSRWTMTDDSTVKNLDLKDGSSIRLNGTDAKHHTLNVKGDLSGVGAFYLNSNITNNHTDNIIVDGTASGTHTLYVNNTGLEPKPHELELLKVGNKGEQLSVSLGNENGRVDLGTYRYQLFEKENSYVLGVAHRNALSNLINEDAPTTELPTQKGTSVTAEDPPSIEFRNGMGVTTDDTPSIEFKNGEGVTVEDVSSIEFKNGAGVTAEDAPVAHFKNGIGVTTEDSPQQSYISRYSNTGLSELSAQVNSLLHINQNIDQEIINHDKQDLRAWAQVSKQKSKQESNLYRPYQQSINLTQFGIEQRVGNDIIVGSVLSHSSDHSQFDDGIAGKQNLKQINLYTKKMWDNGIFTAIDGSYTSSRTKLNNQLTFKRHIFSLGSILGKEWVLNNVIFKPSIGVRYYHLSKSNYSVDNASIEIEPINMISYQAGFSLSKIIQLGEFKFKPEISSYFVDASLKKLRVNVNQNALQQQFGRYIKNEITSTLQNNNWNISIGLGFTKGNEIKNQRFATLKLGYNW